MKNTKLNKALITVLCFAVVMTFSASVFAASPAPAAADPFSKISANTATNAADSTYTIGNEVLGIIQIVGILLSVGCLMILGIKYMMGSAEEKAEYKKTFIPYIIGAVLLFAASAFAKIIYDWVQNIA